MIRISFAYAIGSSLALSLALGIAGCGDDDGSGDNTPVADAAPVADSAPPDATPTPDAAACALTMCGDDCVDTTEDTAHCGGCDMACDSPGQICSGALPCACPPNFIPDSIEPGPFDQVSDRFIDGLIVAISPILGSPINAVAIGYLPETPIGVDIDLAEGVPPLVAAAYDVDTTTMMFHTSYQANTGILNFTEACLVGARGTVTGATFVEIGGLGNPVPVEGGCEIATETITFDIGEPCPVEGTPDAAPG